MKCPRCQTGITSAPDPAGFMACPGCGARLRRQPTGGGGNVTLPPAGLEARAPEARPGGATEPPLGPRRVGAPAAARSTGSMKPVPKRIGDDTTRVKPMAAAAEAAVAPFSAPPANSPATVASVDALLAEVRAVRALQEEILELLRSRPESSPRAVGDDFEGLHEPAVRSSRRKSVLLVDDDEATRKAAEAALEKGEVPVRTVSEGNAALAAIARDKPDVIVLELGIGGAMGGKDVVNMIKATMEWVDIPIILYTRVPMEGQKEARQIHGADDYVAKGPGGPEAVLAKSIAFFRRP